MWEKNTFSFSTILTFRYSVNTIDTVGGFRGETMTGNFCRNSKGFSLVEVVIVVGLMGVIAVGVASMMADMHKSVARLEDQLSKTGLKERLNFLLAEEDSCNQSMVGKTLSTLNQEIVVKDSTGETVLKSGDVYDYLSVDKIELYTDNPQPNRYNTAELVVFVESQRFKDLRMHPVTVDVHVYLNAAMQVTGCKPDFLTQGDMANYATRDELSQLQDSLKDQRESDCNSSVTLGYGTTKTFDATPYPSGTMVTYTYGSGGGAGGEDETMARAVCINGNWLQI